MARLQRVNVERFRCFERLSLDGLTHVNLFIGRNNAGKTAFLEAIEAVVSEGSPYVLYRASIERGEFRPLPRRDEPDFVAVDVRRWFYGHRFEPGASFSIEASGARTFRLVRTLDRATAPLEDAGRLVLTLERTGQTSERLRELPLIADGLLGAGTPAPIMLQGAKLTPPVIFITTRRLSAFELLPMWSKVVLTPSESDVVVALRTLDPQIDRFALTEGGGQVLFRGAKEPVPLGSLGEGVTRMLTLALSLAAARGGFLLVDEIETGLHYTAHRDMWRLVIETARRLDVQVFATTHSKDCLEAIARLHEDEPETAAEVTVHRLEAGAPTAVRMTAATIAGSAEGHVEVR